MNNFTAESSIVISATASQVWDALTNPEMIKKYLFGTEAKSDWEVGSDIAYTGEWQGKTYEDKGKILRVEPQRLLETTYWSSMSGKDDKPENYNTVTYSLESAGDGTQLTITQDNITSEEGRLHSQKNWDMVLASLKKLLEQN